MRAPLPPNETERLAALHSYHILDTTPESGFDDLTQLAAQICNTPIALVAFVDKERQWFKSRLGLDVTETPRDLAFCAHTILRPDEMLEVHDAHLDPRFANNPLVTTDPKIRFYAGVPLVSKDGCVLGTLNVIDYQPRQLTPLQKSSLQALSRQAMVILELRHAHFKQKYIEEQLRQSEERARDLLDNANDIIQSVDMEGRFQYVNRAWHNILGYSEAEMAHLKLWDIISPDELPHCKEQFQQITSGQSIQQITTIFRAKNGQKVYLEGNSNCRLVDGKAVSTRSIFRDISPRKQAEQERDRLFQYSIDMICIASFDGYLKQLNPACEKTLGWSMAELLAKPFIEFVHPDDRESVRHLTSSLRNDMEVLEYQNRYLCKDGSYKWIAWIGYPLREEGLIFTIARDVTTQKQAEAELNKIMGRQRAILQHAGYGIITTTANGVVESINPAAEKMLGIPAAALLGVQAPDEFLDKNEVALRAQMFSAELGETITGTFETFVAKARHNLPNQYEWTFTHSSGTRFPGLVSITALRDQSGEISGYMAHMVDISEQKRAQLALEQFKYTLDQTVDCVFICRADDFRFVYVNEGAQRQVGYTEEELYAIGVPDIKRKYSVKDYQLLVQPLLDGKIPSLTFETLHRHKDGHDIPVEVTTQAVRLAGQEPRLVSVVRDITDRRRAEQLLRAKNTELKAFAYNVSHDLKAPLRGIMGYAQELERRHQPNLPDRAIFCISQIITASQNLDALIEDLLKYSRLETELPQYTEVNLFQLVHNILRDRSLALTALNVQVSVKIPPIILHGWERGLLQILTNLIDNAIKYSRQSQPPTLEIRAETLPAYYRISVMDNGIGFDMKYHDRIYGLFNRLVRATEFEGTGAGLAITKKLVEKLGGSIHAQSAPGQGATFTIELPILPPPFPPTAHHHDNHL